MDLMLAETKPGEMTAATLTNACELRGTWLSLFEAHRCLIHTLRLPFVPIYKVYQSNTLKQLLFN